MTILMLRHALLLPVLQGGPLQLSTRRTAELFLDGNRIWKVELHRGPRLLASWPAASGVARRQSADRRWSPRQCSPFARW